MANDGSPSEDENDNYAQEKHMVVLSDEKWQENLMKIDGLISPFEDF